tara:strand:+ start:55 stop:861 length:807 start_codon:yes stop_codon:yes gene_type:complete
MAKTDLTNKTPRETYKDLLQIGTAGSGTASGFGGGSYGIYDGAGNASCMAMGKNNLLLSPTTTDGYIFQVTANNGDRVLRCNSSTNEVTISHNNHHATSQLVNFYTSNCEPSATGHFPMGRDGNYSVSETHFGTSTDPTSAIDISTVTASARYDLIQTYFVAMGDMQIDKCVALAMTDNVADDTCEFHLMKYDMSVSAGSKGDLSNGSVLAYSSNLTINSQQIVSDELTLTGGTGSQVTAGQVIIGVLKVNSTTGDFYTNLQVQYHLI